MTVGGHCKTTILDGRLDSLDLEPKPGGQIGALHEMGHYLGLNHVDHGHGDGYGAVGSYQAGDIMGRGTRLDAWHAWPWKHRLPVHQIVAAPIALYPRGLEWRGSVGRPGA